MKNKSNLITIIVFITLVYSLSVLNVFSKDKDFSLNENRYLASKPKVTIKSVFDGQFGKKFEQYINDQFVFRNLWMGSKTSLQIGVKNKDINGVYICDNGYLIEQHLEKDFDNKQFENNINYISEFTNYCKNYIDNKNISVMIVPNAELILEENLPKYAQSFDQNEKIDKVKLNANDVNFIDVRDILKSHKDENIFYKTDHHWTTKGAFLAYEEWCNSVEKTQYTLKRVSSSFRGSLYSKVLYNKAQYDNIDLFLDKTKYTVTYANNGFKSESIYDFDKLKEKDKYQVFFGGNHSEIKINTENKNNKNLLVVKDSFANSFIPFIIKDYENIYILDLRYYKGNVKEYFIQNNITDIFILYNIINFSNDKNISKLRG